MEAAKQTAQKVLWIDLEMTGLDPQRDRIVEVAAIVTDWQFTELASFESGVRQDKALLRKLFAANDWAMARPDNTNQLIDLSLKSPISKDVENELLAIVDAHFSAHEPALLAGNSIHCDRSFIKQWWPSLDARLHYRMLDVSAWKVVMQGKYGREFKKRESHRALGDIRESIAELQQYLQWAHYDTRP